MPSIEKILFKEDGSWEEYDSLTLDHSKFVDSKRGISFISLEGQNRLTNDEIKGFCHKRFKANFVVNGIDTKELTVGQSIQIGDAIIKITSVEKDCLSECPIINKSNVSCNVNKEAFFGAVLRQGVVNQNDHITLL